MGRGSYTASDWASLRSSRGLVKNQSTENLFVNKMANLDYDTRNVAVRESRDSSDSPESTPIIIGFDVTASMSYLAKELATNSINQTVMTLLDQKPISNPHIMCSAIGDCKSDNTPLQVTQFEADIRIINQLLELHLEGGGGGNGGESYNLLWYFASHHTEHDALIKRNKKGFIFTIGDDYCHNELNSKEINNVFKDSSLYSISNQELLAEVSKKYHVVHIHIERNTVEDAKILQYWKNILPGRSTVINAADIAYLADLITTIISVLAGKTVNSALKNINQSVAEKISRSMALIAETKEEKKISF